MTQDTSAAPDWYPDPERPGALRYWDGESWTDHRAERGKPKPEKHPAYERGEGEPEAFGLVVALVVGVAVLLLTLFAAIALR